MKLIAETIELVGLIALAAEVFRLRRRLKFNEQAKEAEEMLGPPRIGDIVMPNPGDPRWKREKIHFGGLEGPDKWALTLGGVIVEISTHHVWIDTVLAQDGEPYGRRVVIAYQQRIAQQAIGGTP